MTTTPDGLYIEYCPTKTCRASVIWAYTGRGRLVPIDSRPAAGGTVRVFRLQNTVRCREVSAGDAARMARDPLAVPLRTFHENHVRLAGHTLPREGAAVLNTTGDGRAGATRCTCGDVSPVLTSDRKRKQWHREHKDKIRRGGAR